MAVAAGLVGACLPRSDLPEPAPEPRLDLVAFFAGDTAGQGRLTTLIGHSRTIAVTSHGEPGPRGLVLNQLIREEGKAPRERTWTMESDDGLHFTGSLDEAIGPVRIVVDGNHADIAYRTEDYGVRQRLVLASDGSIANRLDVIKWGFAVARLEERIARAD